jgi:hypothetical protein
MLNTHKEKGFSGVYVSLHQHQPGLYTKGANIAAWSILTRDNKFVTEKEFIPIIDSQAPRDRKGQISKQVYGCIAE